MRTRSANAALCFGRPCRGRARRDYVEVRKRKERSVSVRPHGNEKTNVNVLSYERSVATLRPTDARKLRKKLWRGTSERCNERSEYTYLPTRGVIVEERRLDDGSMKMSYEERRPRLLLPLLRELESSPLVRGNLRELACEHAVMAASLSLYIFVKRI